MLKSIGVSFSPAGLLTPFHVGVSQYLQEIDIITQSTHVSGSSGGALAAACTGLGISSQDTILATCSIAKRCRDLGNYGTLRSALDLALEEILPQDAHTQLNNRSGDVCIAYRQCFPEWKSQLVDEFEDRDDLIDVLRVR